MENTADTDNGVLETIRRAIDDASATTVFGAPISQDGLTVLPVAKVCGGGGGGANRHPAKDGREDNRSSGGGLGVTARPLGVFVIENGKVAWRPAVDVNRVILGGQLVAVVALLTVRALVKARRPRTATRDRPGSLARWAQTIKDRGRGGHTFTA